MANCKPMNKSSALSRSLGPLAGLSWALFIVTSALVAGVWITGFGEGLLEENSFKRAVPNPELRSSLVLFSRAIDPAWIVLGAVAIYLGTARSEGLAMARRWAVVIMVIGFGLSALSVRFQWPLGPVYFPENLGWTIGPIPFGIPLLWLVIIAGAREAALLILPRAGHAMIAFTTGLLTLLTVANLDPVAWKYRAWWLWYPKPFEGPNHAPWQSYLTWLLASVTLAWIMRSNRVLPQGGKRPWSPVIVWTVLNLTALLTHIALRVR